MAVHSLHEGDGAIAEHQVQVFAVNGYLPHLVNILDVQDGAENLAIKSNRVSRFRRRLAMSQARRCEAQTKGHYFGNQVKALLHTLSIIATIFAFAIQVHIPISNGILPWGPG